MHANLHRTYLRKFPEEKSPGSGQKVQGTLCSRLLVWFSQAEQEHDVRISDFLRVQEGNFVAPHLFSSASSGELPSLRMGKRHFSAERMAAFSCDWIVILCMRYVARERGVQFQFETFFLYTGALSYKYNSNDILTDF